MRAAVALLAVVCCAHAQLDAGAGPAAVVAQLRGHVDSVATAVDTLLEAVSGSQPSLQVLGKAAESLSSVSASVQEVQNLVTHMTVEKQLSGLTHDEVVAVVSTLHDIVNHLFDLVSAHISHAHASMQQDTQTTDAQIEKAADVSASLDTMSAQVQQMMTSVQDSMAAQQVAEPEAVPSGAATAVADAPEAETVQEEAATAAAEPAATAAPESGAELPLEDVKLPGYLSAERLSHVERLMSSAMWLHWQEVQNKERWEQTNRQQAWLHEHAAELAKTEAELRAREASVDALRARLDAAERALFGEAPAPAATAASDDAVAEESEPAPEHVDEELADAASADEAGEAAHEHEHEHKHEHRSQREMVTLEADKPLSVHDAARRASELLAETEREQEEEDKREHGEDTGATGGDGRVIGGEEEDYVVASRGFSDLPPEQTREYQLLRMSREAHRLYAKLHEERGHIIPTVVGSVDTHIKEHWEEQAQLPPVVTDPQDVTRPEREPTVQVERVKTREELAIEADPHAAQFTNVEPAVVPEEEVHDAVHQQTHGKYHVITRMLGGPEEVVGGTADVIHSPEMKGLMPRFNQAHASRLLRGAPRALQPLALLEVASRENPFEGDASADTEGAIAPLRSDRSEPLGGPFSFPNPQDFGATEDLSMRPWSMDASDMPPLPQVVV